MVKKLAIIREIFKGDHNEAAAVRKLTRNQISALSGTLNYNIQITTMYIQVSNFELTY